MPQETPRAPSDASFPSMMIKHRAGPCKADWENHRAQITQLYRDEKKPLKDVVVIMKQHQFSASWVATLINRYTRS